MLFKGTVSYNDSHRRTLTKLPRSHSQHVVIWHSTKPIQKIICLKLQEKQINFWHYNVQNYVKHLSSQHAVLPLCFTLRPHFPWVFSPHFQTFTRPLFIPPSICTYICFCTGGKHKACSWVKCLISPCAGHLVKLVFSFLSQDLLLGVGSLSLEEQTAPSEWVCPGTWTFSTVLITIS